jgi:hypothetical protein
MSFRNRLHDEEAESAAVLGYGTGGLAETLDEERREQGASSEPDEYRVKNVPESDVDQIRSPHVRRRQHLCALPTRPSCYFEGAVMLRVPRSAFQTAARSSTRENGLGK